MRSGRAVAAIEIPPGFGRDVSAARQLQIVAWFDGAMPQRGRDGRAAYVQGIHQHWLADAGAGTGRGPTALLEVEPATATTPMCAACPPWCLAVIPLLLFMLPAMLTALAVGEKERVPSSTSTVTPTTRTEFLVGKQLPHVALAMLNFSSDWRWRLSRCSGVPITGSFATG